MILNRTDDEDQLTLINAATRRKHHITRGERELTIPLTVFGYDGIILEASETSQVLSVTLV